MKATKAIMAILLMGCGMTQADTFYDNFDRADGPLGVSWTTEGGNFSISNNAVANTTTGNAVAYWNQAQTLNDGTNGFAISATLTLNAEDGTAWTGLAFNYQNPSNFYSFRFSGLGDVQLWRIVDGTVGTFYNAAGTEFTHVANHPYRLEVSSAEPYAFRVSIKDAVTGEVLWSKKDGRDTSSSFKDGYGGLYATSLAVATFDDFGLLRDVFQDDYFSTNPYGTFDTDAGVSIGSGYVLSQTAGDRLATARILLNQVQFNHNGIGATNPNNIVLRQTGIQLRNVNSNESFSVQGDIKTFTSANNTLFYGLAFNYQPDGSFYAARMSTGGTALQFLRVDAAGAVGAFATVSGTLETNSYYTLQIDSSAPGVFDYTLTGSGLAGGQLTGTATDTLWKLENGEAGFYMNNINTTPLFDNLLVKVALPPVFIGGYNAWAASWGVDIGATTNDYDNDGFSNLYEFGLAGDPTDPADQGISPSFAIVADAGTNYFGYVHPQRSDPGSGIAYHLELNQDLATGTWTNSGYEVLGTNHTGGTLDFVTNITSTVENKKFIRLIIESL